MVWQALLFVAIVMATLLSGIAAVAWTATCLLRRRRAMGREVEPECGRCGYVIHPGSRKVCPECGSDFAEVGVVTPATAPPGYPFLVLWLLGVGATLFAWWAGPQVAARTPWGWNFHAAHLIETSRMRWVPSMHEGAFAVNAKGLGRWWDVHVRELTVSYKVPDGPWMTLDVEDGGAVCRIRSQPRTIGPLPLDREVVEQFIAAAGFDPATPEGLQLVDAVLTRTQQFLAEDLPADSGRRAGDWPGRTQFDSIQFWPNDYAGWVAGFVVWGATMAAASAGLRSWQRRRRSAMIREGRQLVAELRLT
jgi:hypothetical protein